MELGRILKFVPFDEFHGELAEFGLRYEPAK